MARKINFNERMRLIGCSCVGDYELLAGIEQDINSRFEFWIKFKHDNNDLVVSNGVASLLKKIKTRIKRGDLTLVELVDGQYAKVEI